MTMRLSIVIPTLNEASDIEATLKVLQPLRRRGVEVVVVDGDSHDGTPDVARPLADRVIVAPRGRARQMNAGAASASGDVLLFLHADTLLPDYADTEILAALNGSDRVWGRFDVRIVGQPRLLPLVAALMNIRSRLTGIATGDQAMFVRRDHFLAVGGFPDQPLMEDIVLSARLKRAGRPVCLRSRVVTSGRRWERHSFWKTVLLMWWLRLQFYFGQSAERLAKRYYRKEPQRPNTTAVIVFAKAPEPGYAKTRLIPALGADGAAILAERLLDHTLAGACGADAGPVEICCTPDTAHAVFQACACKFNVALSTQDNGDLGHRMAAAASRALDNSNNVLLIGTDCPALGLTQINAAANALRNGHDVVLIPSTDGGYVLIGLRRVHPRLFEDIAWGTPAVMHDTRKRLLELDWYWVELPALSDVDVPADLVHVPHAFLPRRAWLS